MDFRAFVTSVTFGAAVGLIGLGLYNLNASDKPEQAWPPQEKLQVPRETLGPHGFTKQWDNAQGYKIFSYFWPTTVAKPKGILLLLHGHGVNVVFEFLKSSGPGVERKYDNSWIKKLNEEGYSCCGIDVQSNGRSVGYKGLKNYFESFDDVIADDFAFIDKLPELGGKAFSSDLPLFPFGVSMGGARAALMMMKDETRFKGSLFYAPMLSMERVSKEGLNPYLKPLIEIFSKLGPHWRMAKASKNTIFPDLQEEFEKDFFSDQGDARVRVAAEYLKITDLIMSNLDKITLPFVTFHSDADTMTDPDGSRKLVAQATSSIKSYENCPGSWHILINEPGNEKTLEKTIAFLNRINS